VPSKISSRESAGALPKASPPSSGIAHASGKWGVLIAIGTGTFMSALDGSVVNTILPVVRSSFNVDIATVEWVIIVYLLLLSGMLPGFGRLGDLRGHKWVYLAGFMVFIVSSTLCGSARSVTALIAFRGVQALGAAMLSSNSPAILTKSFPSNQRGQALGLQATMTYLGLTVGPALGGWLTDQLSWRAVFFINLPVGLSAMLLGFKMIASDNPTNNAERFDTIGSLIFMSGLIALLLGLNQGHTWGWTSPTILGLFAIAATCLAAFLWLEARLPNPMLDLRLFKRRNFSISTISATINYVCVYSILFLMPFFLIQGRGLSPSQAGLILSIQPIVMAIVAPLSGTISDRIGSRLPGVVGMGVLALGLFMLSRLDAQTPQNQVVLGLGVTGFGIGVFISPNNSALMGSAPYNRQGIAAGVLSTARNVGMVLGIGVAGAIFNTVMAINHLLVSKGLYIAFQTTLLAVAGIAMLGTLVTSIRGEENNVRGNSATGGG